MSKQRKLHVKNSDIAVIDNLNEDYISLTDMVTGFKDGLSLIEKWLRNKNTLEFLAVWESLNNPNFNSPEFEGIRKDAGLNRFTISVKEWSQKTNGIGVISKPGRYGGTFAHKDIAFEFGSWLSPEFKLLLIKEFQRLKDFESKALNLEWDYRRFLSKVNYKIHTDAVKENLIPLSKFPEDKKYLEYSDEADILNFALFNMTAKQWREKYPDRATLGHNIRYYADTHQLTVLSNLESYNAEMISQKIDKRERFVKLRNMAVRQMKSLRENYILGTIESPFVLQEQYQKDQKPKDQSEFNRALEGIMKVPKPKE